MRWSLARMFYLVTAVAIFSAIVSLYANGRWRDENHRFILCAYLALLTMATMVGFNASTLWKRFWLAYALFGWSYLLFLHFLGGSPATYFQGILLGISMGFVCAFAVIAFTDDTVETKKDADDKT